jgi:hypothetical protein
MNETVRTVILLVLLAVGVGFIWWIGSQSEANLQGLAPITQGSQV